MQYVKLIMYLYVRPKKTGMEMEDIMSKYSKQDIIDMVEEEDVEFIRLQFTDIFGNFKNVAITSSQLERALNNNCMFDGSAIEGFARIEESDMILYPDLDTFTIFPWRPQQGKVARLICDVYKADRTPYEADPRHILKRVVSEAAEMGYEFNVGPECEFYIFHTDDESAPTTVTHEKAGYFDIGPIDYGENARRDMILTLEDMGFEVESSHHEVSPAQHEIDFKYDEALKTADNIMTFQLTVRTIARRHGLHATFMPKPLTDANGSGMHMNMSLNRDGKNIFCKADGEHGFSKEAEWFIGGILKHIKGMTAVLNPNVNSYKRLLYGGEAPTDIAWSSTNRSLLIRVPASYDDQYRIELRSPDASCNPYIATAVCLAAGLDGIRNQIEPPESLDRNVYEMSEVEKNELGIEPLPTNLFEAVKELEADEYILKVLGRQYTEKYIAAKKKEWHAYSRQVTQWEIDNLLYKM